MEPKKNAKHDVNRHRALLLNAGLIVSLVIVICAFEWSVSTEPEKVVLNAYQGEDMTVVDYPRPTNHEKKELPKPKPVATVKPLQAVIIKEVSTNDYAESPNPEIDVESLEPSPFVGLEDIPEEVTPVDTFLVVENMPEPIGGWSAFTNTLSKNLKYPKRAQQTGTTGKVFVQFTVNSHGEVVLFSVLKGIGQGCDEEAMRVLALTKWKPGKQRGRAVNVKMVQPVNFTLKQ